MQLTLHTYRERERERERERVRERGELFYISKIRMIFKFLFFIMFQL
jgi:hypothetical protein